MKTAQDILNDKNRSIISVQTGVTVFDAVKVMVQNKIGAIAVKDGGEIVGIFTERDLLNLTAGDNFDPKTAVIKDYMKSNLVSAQADDPLHKLQDLLLGKFLRHLFIKKDEEVIGLLSAGDITRADLLEKEQNLKAVSWDYYENWCWKKK